MSRALLFLLAALLALPGGDSAVADSAPVRLYVAVDGDDAATGSEAHPFRTLERARDALRALRAHVGLPKGGAAIVIGAGRYARSETFLLRAEDGGRADAPVQYVAAPDAEVVLHGAV